MFLILILDIRSIELKREISVVVAAFDVRWRCFGSAVARYASH